jgi:hypothetical protein
MSELQSLFKEAFRLWHKRPFDEPPKHGYPTYDHFKKLGDHIGTIAIKLGFGGLKMKVSVGMGCWAEIPWVGLRNPYSTDSFEQGVYVVYLLAPDYDELFLALIQGVTEFTSEQLKESTPRLRSEIERPNGFDIGINGKLARHTTINSKPDKYERGIFYSKIYSVRTFPDDEILKRDLKAVLQVYRVCANKFI